MAKENEARSAQKLDITLPNEMIQMVKAKVSSGEYATENEVILEGLRALQVQERALEHCRHADVQSVALRIDLDRYINGLSINPRTGDWKVPLAV